MKVISFLIGLLIYTICVTGLYSLAVLRVDEPHFLFQSMEDGSYLILTPMTNCIKGEKVCGYNAHKVDPEKVEEFIK